MSSHPSHSTHLLPARWKLPAFLQLLKPKPGVNAGDIGILQARILEWVAFPLSRGSSQHKDQTQVSRTAGGFFFFNWRLNTLQYCSGFCHTLTWISHGCTCVPILNPPPTSLLIPSLRVIPVHWPWAPRLMHCTWTGDLFHIWWYTCFSAILSDHPTLTFSHRVQKSVLYIYVSFAVSHTGSSLPSF